MTRVETGIREGKERTQVFPRLRKAGAFISGEGLEVQVRFVKQENALPVKFKNDEEVDAAAIRTVDQQKKYHWKAFGIAEALGISRPRATALRTHLGIYNDPNICHTFVFSKQKHATDSQTHRRMLRPAGASIPEIDDSPDLRDQYVPSQGARSRTGSRANNNSARRLVKLE